ncbi:hypothetical protein GCM10028772_14450 [Nocardioides ultimimeridianus]
MLSPPRLAGMGVETGEPAVRRARWTGRVRRRQLTVWQETALLLVLALGLAIVIKAFFLQAFYIPSASMVPGLQGGPGYPVNDRVLVEKPSYWFGGSPQRGDVIVFSDPGGWLPPGEDANPTGVQSLLSKVGLYPSGGHLVKRVIGLPGDTVHCCNAQGELEVNGTAVDESGFLNQNPGPGECDAPLSTALTARGTPFAAPCDWTVGPIPSGQLFVLGDNRSNSEDGRAHLCKPGDASCTKVQFVPEGDVVGKVFALVWPRSRWTWVGRAEAFAGVPDPATR